MSEVPDSLRKVGIEIELEGISHSAIPSKALNKWYIHEEGSLRGGLELVSTVLGPEEIEPALELVEDVVANSNASWRCAVHVHVDVRDCTIGQVSQVIAGYLLVERLLFTWEGNNRDQSKFCVPAYKSRPIIHSYADWSGIGHIKDHLFDRSAGLRAGTCSKYCAFNILPIERQGSVEFRHAQTTNDINKIRDFAVFCSSIVSKFASIDKGSNPILMLSEMREGFIDWLLPEYLSDQVKDIDDWQTVLWSGITTGSLYKSMMDARASDIEKRLRKDTSEDGKGSSLRARYMDDRHRGDFFSRLQEAAATEWTTADRIRYVSSTDLDFGGEPNDPEEGDEEEEVNEPDSRTPF